MFLETICEHLKTGTRLKKNTCKIRSVTEQGCREKNQGGAAGVWRHICWPPLVHHHHLPHHHHCYIHHHHHYWNHYQLLDQGVRMTYMKWENSIIFICHILQEWQILDFQQKNEVQLSTNFDDEILFCEYSSLWHELQSCERVSCFFSFFQSRKLQFQLCYSNFSLISQIAINVTIF